MATGALTEQVAEELEQAAVVTRRIDGKMVASFWIGVGVGVGIGFYVGYRYSKKKLRAEILEEAEREISEIREHYRQKTVAAEAQSKPPVKKIVEERGYSTDDGEELKIEYARLDDPAETRPIRPPVPVAPARRTGKTLPTPIDPHARVFRTHSAEKDKNEGWSYPKEVAKRSPGATYIIHQDEYTLNESGYEQVVYVYYEIDDVLVDNDDPQTILNNRENLIGEEALNHFGHGTDDFNIVYVRNSELELEFEINRVQESWEEEVAGLNRDEPS